MGCLAQCFGLLQALSFQLFDLLGLLQKTCVVLLVIQQEAALRVLHRTEIIVDKLADPLWEWLEGMVTILACFRGGSLWVLVGAAPISCSLPVVSGGGGGHVSK